MLNLVPFAGAWREMTDRNGQPRFIGESLQLQFPKLQSRPIASSAVGTNWSLTLILFKYLNSDQIHV